MLLVGPSPASFGPVFIPSVSSLSPGLPRVTRLNRVTRLPRVTRRTRVTRSCPLVL